MCGEACISYINLTVFCLVILLFPGFTVRRRVPKVNFYGRGPNDIWGCPSSAPAEVKYLQ